MHVETDDVLDLLGEGGIVGTLEGPQAMRGQIVGLPDALDGGERQARRPGHGPAGPVGGLARRLGAGQCHDLGDDRQGHRRLAGLAAALAQQPIDAALGVVALPAPDRRATDFRPAGHLLHRQPLGRVEDDPGALDMLQRQIAVADDRGKPRAILGGNDHGNGLGHASRIAQPDDPVNPMIGSMH